MEIKKIFLVLLFFLPLLCFGQTVITLDSALAMALRTHPQIQFSQQEIEFQKALKKGSFSLQNPDVWVESPTATKFAVGIQQTFQSPLAYIQQSKVAKQNISLAEKGLSLSKSALIKAVRTAYLNLLFAETSVKQMQYQDSIFNNLYLASEKRFNAGEADLLEKISAEAKAKEIQNLLTQTRVNLQNAQIQLQILTGIKEQNLMTNQNLERINQDFTTLFLGDTSVFITSPFIKYYRQNILVNSQLLKLEKSKLVPGIVIGYLNQGYSNTETLYRLRFGLSIPFWFWTYNSQIKAANYRLQIANSQYVTAQRNLSSEFQQALTDYNKYLKSMNYYESVGLKQAEAIINTATRSYQSGNINYIVYMQSLNQAFEIKINYLEATRNYNQSIIQINYLNGQ